MLFSTTPVPISVLADGDANESDDCLKKIYVTLKTLVN